MTKQRTQTRTHGIITVIGRILIFMTCGTAAFLLGMQMTSDVAPVEQTIAQAGTTQVNIILQYQPVSGGAPLPIEVTPFMNGSQNALLQLVDIHTNTVQPGPASRCKTTNAAGRCDIMSVPVGPDPDAANVDRQYDIIVDTVFIETLTNIPFESELAFVRFSPSKCSGSTTSFNGDTWCLTKSGGNFAAEYFVTVTLNERDVCTETAPPAQFCSGDNITTFSCNPRFTGATRPWEPVTNSCDPVLCPDGNTVGGKCAAATAGLEICSTAAACANNQLCAVQNFATSVVYEAGADTIVITGRRFGTQGGSVSFAREDGGKETVEISPGPDWTDSQIRVLVPQSAVSGVLQIHPNTHGFFLSSSGLTPLTCASPTARVRPFSDQFVILSITAQSPNGIALVSPGFDTRFTLLARHNENVGRFDSILVELAEGTFTDPDNLPLNRTLITQKSCPVRVTGSALAKEAQLECAVPVPQSAAQRTGPFTFIVTLFDNQGGSARTVLLAGGTSALIGDFSQDGALSLLDAVIAFRIANGSVSATQDHLVRDTNGDGAITVIDALFVLHSLTQ